jgi:rubrerythrin
MLRFLSVCAEIEDVVGNIYKVLAERVECDATLRELWTQMARDEEAHAMQIRFALRLPSSHAFKSQTLPLVQAEQLLRSARGILAGARTSPVNERLALRLSLKLEEDFIAIHISSAMAFRDDSLRQMLNCLGSADRNHVEKLRKICNERMV